MKLCEVCGKEIPKLANDSAKYYAARRFCSLKCNGLNRRKETGDRLKCSKCKETKPKEDFRRDNTAPRGYQYYCKVCSNRLAQKYEGRDPATLRERQRLYRATNMDKYRQRDKLYFERNQELVKQRRRTWYKRFPEVARAQTGVNSAIRHGLLPQLGAIPCARCYQIAKHYHHPSYHADDRLNVIPLCISCHILAHKRPEVAAEIESGVVMTSVGMVHIAIASHD